MDTTTTSPMELAERTLTRMAPHVLRGIPDADVDDILQNVRLTLWAKIVPAYDPARGPIKHYLNKSIRHALLDERERRVRAAKLDVMNYEFNVKDKQSPEHDRDDDHLIREILHTP